MTDITTLNLDAALLDQKVAGQFGRKPYAYVSVVAVGGWALGVAVANERGYSPIAGKTFKTMDEADAWADGLNEHIGLTREDRIRIVISTMGGKEYHPEK